MRKESIWIIRFLEVFWIFKTYAVAVCDIYIIFHRICFYNISNSIVYSDAINDYPSMNDNRHEIK